MSDTIGGLHTATYPFGARFESLGGSDWSLAEIILGAIAISGSYEMFYHLLVESQVLNLAFCFL